MHKASFIIPSYNSYKTISKTLDSILGLSSVDSSMHEVIVVDCSDDSTTRKMLKAYTHPKLILIESQKGTPASARNTGAAMATGDVLCFIDSDAFLEKYWLKHVLKAYASGCQAGAGSIGVPYFQNRNFLALAQLYLQFNESLQTGDIKKVAMIPACNMFVDRQLFNKVGGFPKLRAAEDVLFCLKFAEYGSIWFIPEAQCFHIFREEKKPYFQNQIVLGKYIIIYRRLFYKAWYYRKPWGTMLLPFFLMVKTVKITARIMKAGHVHFERFIWSFPLFLAGLFYWAVGFYQGSLQTNIAGEN